MHLLIHLIYLYLTMSDVKEPDAINLVYSFLPKYGTVTYHCDKECTFDVANNTIR